MLDATPPGGRRSPKQKSQKYHSGCTQPRGKGARRHRARRLRHGRPVPMDRTRLWPRHCLLPRHHLQTRLKPSGATTASSFARPQTTSLLYHRRLKLPQKCATRQRQQRVPALAISDHVMKKQCGYFYTFLPHPLVKNQPPPVLAWKSNLPSIYPPPPHDTASAMSTKATLYPNTPFITTSS